MKILKKGTIPQPKIRLFRGKCPNCGCEIECTDNEAQVTAERHMGGKQLWTIACPFKLLSYTCGSIIPLVEVVTREESLAEAADSLCKFQQKMKSLEDNIFVQADRKLRGLPTEYPVNYGKEVPVDQPKSEMAKAFEDFFKPAPGENGWWEKEYLPPKKTPRPPNELSQLADDL